MFSVLFEVCPHPAHHDDYLGFAKELKPELEGIDGFVDNIRYRSLTREGWLLSLSSWRDEKAVVRWRTRANHHEVQQKGRSEVLRDYHLRVGQITADTHIPAGHVLKEQRLDETDIGEGTAATLFDRKAAKLTGSPEEIARTLGITPDAPGLVAWDVYDAVLTPGDMIAMCVWRKAPTPSAAASPDVRVRSVRIVRDYSLKDRREAPQYFPDETR